MESYALCQGPASVRAVVGALKHCYCDQHGGKEVEKRACGACDYLMNSAYGVCLAYIPITDLHMVSQMCIHVSCHCYGVSIP